MFLRDKILTQAKAAIAAQNAFHLFTKTDVVFDKGIKFFLHYYDPRFYEGDKPPQPQKTNPLMPPYLPHVFVDHLSNGAAHNIQVNKYSFKIGHVVVSSDNPSDRQGDMLNDKDFHAFSQILLDFGNRGIGYYNSGVQSGCSQLHKHIQYIPNDDNPIASIMKRNGNLPFLYYTKQINWFSYDAIKNAYKDLFTQMKKGKFGEQIKHYNFILTEGNAFIVPRKLARHPYGITLNSLGMCGHYFLWEKDKELIKQNPLKVLTDLTYSA